MLTDQDKKDIAKLVIDELLSQLRIGVGKSILDSLWKWFISIVIVGAIYVYAQSHKI